MLEHAWDGYPKAVNRLCREVLKQWPETLVCVTGGDDIEPDPEYSPEEIQQWFLERACDGCFYEFDGHEHKTYGVMQPTGDPWADSQGRIIERIAGSPWMGRAWILESCGGNGPILEEFHHYYEDEWLQRAAQMQGVFWPNPLVTQKHNHWTKNGGERPAFLHKAQAKWQQDKATFEACVARNFSESLPKG